MWLAVARHAAAEAAAVLQRHLDADLTEDERRAAHTVVDLDAEETTCPACQSTFRTAGASRCPECGLNFG